jgi:hypothetical protein
LLTWRIFIINVMFRFKVKLNPFIFFMGNSWRISDFTLSRTKLQLCKHINPLDHVIILMFISQNYTEPFWSIKWFFLNQRPTVKELTLIWARVFLNYKFRHVLSVPRRLTITWTTTTRIFFWRYFFLLFLWLRLWFKSDVRQPWVLSKLISWRTHKLFLMQHFSDIIFFLRLAKFRHGKRFFLCFGI